VNRAIDDWPGIQQEAICYQWFKQWLILILIVCYLQRIF